MTKNPERTESYHWQLHGETQAQLKSNRALYEKIDGYFTKNGIATQVAINKNKIGWLSKFVWGLFIILITAVASGGAAVAFKIIWP